VGGVSSAQSRRGVVVPAVGVLVSYQRSQRRMGGEKLTSNKLEGLGYKLVAVLVVRHDCSGLIGVQRSGVATMAGEGSKW
jgi:hypothetical protein